ncbi:protein of unknown function [Methylorubrum extorquens]|uniref:Uncharacterized protein n=1 Tax=Methylorubrum extorquens TaxID=408 RepID=A0A2N9AY22_METEX|nr:protein of unknown function [Methylorubrum extorquens]
MTRPAGDGQAWDKGAALSISPKGRHRLSDKDDANVASDPARAAEPSVAFFPRSHSGACP